MLDIFAILTAGGIILWLNASKTIKYADYINEVMVSLRKEGMLKDGTLTSGSFQLLWTVHRDLNLIFVAGYAKILPLAYIPSLLDQVKSYVANKYSDSIESKEYECLKDFDTIFEEILKIVQQRISSPSQRNKQNSPASQEPVKEGKKKRDWGDKITTETAKNLDLSNSKEEEASDRSCIDLSQQVLSEIEDLQISNLEKKDNDKGRLWGYFDKFTGTKELTSEDLKDPLLKMKDHLINKNVASDVADTICSDVEASLLKKKTGAFSTIAGLVKNATESSIERILSLQSNFDFISEIKQISQQRPYIMAFVGVNGVGKSTNLSKVCFYLMQNGLKVLLVAGDTFRSGAVEQLRTHVRNLSSGRAGSVELFEKGYGKDPATIAKDAVNYAKNNKIDVVMIDTAGRMQDNVPLMAALAKLVYFNNPDILIFVGEALVGNEAVDQLIKFNKALNDHCPSNVSKVKQIDGILLTKFDTIDDKVGAVLSMTNTAKAPVLFVGTGQTYTDLRRLNVSSIISSLIN